MKHKLILMRKVKNKLSTGREIIGLIGTHPGTGVTYTALMLAFYMGEVLGKRTAFLECNDHQDFGLIQRLYEWQVQEQTYYTFQRITCFPQVNLSRIADIFGEDYECIIIDFGTDIISNKEEFLRCSRKIVIGGRSEWDRLKLKTFISNTNSIRGNNTWQYFIPLANRKIVNKLSQETKRRFWSVPQVEDPTIPTYHSNHFFSDLLSY